MALQLEKVRPPFKGRFSLVALSLSKRIPRNFQPSKIKSLLHLKLENSLSIVLFFYRLLKLNILSTVVSSELICFPKMYIYFSFFWCKKPFADGRKERERREALHNGYIYCCSSICKRNFFQCATTTWSYCPGMCIILTVDLPERSKLLTGETLSFCYMTTLTSTTFTNFRLHF